MTIMARHHRAAGSALQQLLHDASECANPDCEASPNPDLPVPLCDDCARKVALRWLAIKQETKPERIGPEERGQIAARMTAEQSVVYYARMATGRIKIGFTTNMRQRCISLRIPADAVLATEPGGADTERLRHRQFAHLRIGRWEEFEPADELLGHMARVHREHGSPAITTYVHVPLDRD